MGGLLNRSSGEGDGTKIKGKKDKRKQRHQQFDESYASDIFFIQDGYENEEPDGDLNNSYDTWEKNFDRQQMRNMNDPPGAPSTYPSNYPITQNDIVAQSWPPPQNNNNSFYLINSHQMTPSYNISYDPNQYNHAQISKTMKQEERPSKKVQFSPSIQQQPPALKPLSSTQSWQNINVTPTNISVPKKSMPLSNKLSTTVEPNTSSVQKPIYVTIDHKATLAERGQTTANKHHRKTRTNELNSPQTNHRSSSQTNDQRTRPKPTIKFSGSSQSKFFNSQQPLTRSMSSTVLTQNTEQISSKNDENHRRHRRHHHQQHLSNGSPLHGDFSPHTHSNQPMMRIPLSQNNRHHQKQSRILSGTTSSTNLSRI